MMSNIFNNKNNKDLEQYNSEYVNEEKEIIMLTSDMSGGAGLLTKSWSASQYTLAYIELSDHQLYVGDGRVTWLLTDEEIKEHGPSYPYHFRGGTNYKLSVREIRNKIIPEGQPSSYCSDFAVVEVLDEEVTNTQLADVLAEYRKPITLSDGELGDFDLMKDYGMFEGRIIWKGTEVSVMMEVDVNDRETWNTSIEILRQLYRKQDQLDKKFREYAAQELTELANEWSEDEEHEITKEEFRDRINLSELVTTYEGSQYTAYYDDDDMFYGHVISVEGDLTSGPNSSTIEG